MFNSVKQSRNSKPLVNVRHDRYHETPLPLYLGLKVHAVTRSKTLVDTLFHLGLCISYDRVLQIQSDIANGVCQRYEMEKVVCPPNMRRGLFTIAAVLFCLFCFICHIYPPFTRKRIVSLYFGREVCTRLGVAFFEVYGPPVFHMKVGRPVKCLAQGHNK